MKTKAEIVENWLPRYTQHPLSDFGEYILLTNFNNYVDNSVNSLSFLSPVMGRTCGWLRRRISLSLTLEWGARMRPLLWIC